MHARNVAEVKRIMKYWILIISLLGGCAVNRAPDYNSSAVTAVCASGDGETVAVSYLNQVGEVTVDFVPSWEELYSLCGNTGGACVNMATFEIHMIDDRRCVQHASHELGHVFEVKGIDNLRQVNQRRYGFHNG